MVIWLSWVWRRCGRVNNYRLDQWIPNLVRALPFFNYSDSVLIIGPLAHDIPSTIHRLLYTVRCFKVQTPTLCKRIPQEFNGPHYRNHLFKRKTVLSSITPSDSLDCPGYDVDVGGLTSVWFRFQTTFPSLSIVPSGPQSVLTSTIPGWWRRCGRLNKCVG